MAIAGQSLILKRAAASRPSGEWNDDVFDVLADGVVVGPHLQTGRLARRGCGRWPLGIMRIARAAHGYEPTREAAMAEFAKSWRQE